MLRLTRCVSQLGSYSGAGDSPVYGTLTSSPTYRSLALQSQNTRETRHCQTLREVMLA